MRTFTKKSLLAMCLLAATWLTGKAAIAPFDWTDRATAETSATPASGTLNYLSDNDAATVHAMSAFAPGTWVQYHFTEDIKLTGYSITVEANATDSHPKSWTLQGSDDGTLWTDIDTRTGFTFPTDGYKGWQLSLPSDKETIPAYRYVRITFNATGGADELRVSELQLFGFQAQLTTPVTGNGGIVTAQYDGVENSQFQEGVSNLINNLISKKYCTTGHNRGWVEYISPTRVTLTSYALTSCVANTERDPKSWTLSGYDEATCTWETIDTQSDQTFIMRYSTLQYPVAPTKAYSRFRLNITKNNGGGDLQFCKWQLCGEQTAEARIKVACVGNSITENSALPEAQKYPSLLQRYLGDSYQVLNYGLGGRTLLKEGDKPYWNEKKYKEVKTWLPDIVVIKLGTNDSKASNWAHKDQFVAEYVEFIQSFRELSSNPTVYVCKPLPAYTNNMNIDGTVIRDEILPMIDQIAAQAGVEVIDLHAALEGKQNYLYDNVHPSKEGTDVMAHVIGHAIAPSHAIPDDLYAQIAPFDWTDRATAGTQGITGEGIEAMADNDPHSAFAFSADGTDAWIQFALDEEVKLTGYALTSGNDAAKAPAAWTLLASADGQSWTVIETRTGMQFLHPYDTYLYQTEITYDNRETLPAYRYFRLRMDQPVENAEWAELQLFGFQAQLTTPITGNGGIVTAQYNGYTGEGYGNLTDNSIATKYCVLGTKQCWIEYASPTQVTLNAYSLVGCKQSGYMERDPKSWELSGYNEENAAWELLDKQTEQAFPTRYSTLMYDVNPQKAYSRFRLTITDNQGAPDTQFSKWQLFGTEGNPVIKVACIGNSITANAKLEDKDKYPTILQSLLGSQYNVVNFGEGGATVLKKGTHPYWNQTVYQNALNFAPDIIIVKLGTNDSNPDNWKYKDEFVSDYVEFINSFKAKNPDVQVYLCHPITSWHSTMPIVDQTVTDEIIPLIDEVARQADAEVIDLHTPTFGKVYQTYDYVHPDVRGTTLMAHTIYKALKPDMAAPGMPSAYIRHIDPFDRTDRIVTSSSTDGQSLEALYDNDAETEATLSFAPEVYFDFELPATFRTTGYAITTGSADLKNAPKAWKLQGSNDRQNWTDLDIRTDQQFYYPQETSMYQIAIDGNSSANAANLPACKYIRMLFSENNGGEGLSLAEFQLYGMNEEMTTSITGNGGTISGEHPGFQFESYHEVVENLIDNSIATKYCAPGHNQGWVQYESPTPVAISGYSISSCIGYIGRRPQAWELLGSEDGNSWELLDKQEDQLLFMRLNTTEYAVNTDKPYQFFRLNILKNNGDSDMEFCKWQLFEFTTQPEQPTMSHEATQGISIDTNQLSILIQSAAKDFSYCIYNTSGQAVTQGTTSQAARIPMNQHGMYLVHVRSISGEKMVKVIL